MIGRKRKTELQSSEAHVHELRYKHDKRRAIYMETGFKGLVLASLGSIGEVLVANNPDAPVTIDYIIDGVTATGILAVVSALVANRLDNRRTIRKIQQAEMIMPRDLRHMSDELVVTMCDGIEQANVDMVVAFANRVEESVAFMVLPEGSE